MTPSLRAVPVTDLGRAILLERHTAPAPPLRGRRLWQRRLAVILLACTALLGVGSSTAQAWPWDIGDDIGAFVTYLCKPMDLPTPSTYRGLDTAWGLNDVQNDGVGRTNDPGAPRRTGPSQQRGTIIPDMAGAGTAGKGIERARTAYGQNPAILHPTYERYGFAALRWTSFGASCASVGGWMGTMTNQLKVIFVDFPMMLTMLILNMAMSNDLITALGAILLSPVSGAVFTSFKPIMFFLVTLGAVGILFQVRGSLRGVMNWFVWVVFIMGVYGAMAAAPGAVLGTVNNVVASTGALMASAIQQTQGGYAVNAKSAQQAVGEAVWRGVPYQTWLIGQVGPAQALKDAEDERAGKIGWGPVILNGNYVGDDAAGAKVVAATREWNSRSYAPNGDTTKTDMWTNDNATTGKAWAQIPALGTVKWICNDTTTGTGEGNSSPESNKWLYGGSCDSAGAGTTDMLPHFTGEDYNTRMIALTQGILGAAAVLLALGFACLYLLLQKVKFLYLQVIAPMFLAVGAMGTRNQREIAKRFGWHAGENVLKQCGAIVMVLFTSHVATTVLTFNDVRILPPSTRPFVLMLIFMSMLGMLPMARKVMTGALAGDTSVVDKTVKAPEKVVGVAAKVAVTGATLAVTGGGSALGAGGSAAARSGFIAAGRMLGSGSGLGRMLHTTGRAMQIRDGIVDAVAARAANKEAAAANQAASEKAKEAGVDSLLKGPDKDKYVDENGKPSRDLAGKAYDQLRKEGAEGIKAEEIVKKNLELMYAGYHKQHGEHHPNDPKNPINVKAEAIAKSVDSRLASAEAKSRYEEIIKTRKEEQDLRTNGPLADRGMPGTAPAFDKSASVVHGADLAAGVRGKHGGPATAEDLATASRGMYDHGYMDPRHPATAPLQALHRARDAFDFDAARAAMPEAAAAVHAHGLPNRFAAPKDGMGNYSEIETSEQLTQPLRDRGLNPTDLAGAVSTSAYRNSFMDPMHPATPLLQQVEKAQDAYRADPNQLTLGNLTAAKNAAGQIIETEGLPARMGPPLEASDMARAEHVARLRQDSPEIMFKRRHEFPPSVQTPSASVLSQADMTSDAAMNQPEMLLRNGYRGQTFNLDPYHPASEHLLNLNFAQAAGDETGFEAARQAAAVSMRHRGVPPVVTGPTSNEVPDYDGSQILSVMPQLKDDASWQDRAAAALTMQRAYAQMPQSHEAARAVGTYVSALGDPETPLVDVRALGLHAASVLAPAAPAPAGGYTESSGGLAEFDFGPRGPRAPEPAPPPPEFSDAEPSHDWVDAVPAPRAPRRRGGAEAAAAPAGPVSQEGQGWGSRLAEHLRSAGAGEDGQVAEEDEVVGMGEVEPGRQPRRRRPQRSSLFDGVRAELEENRQAREEDEI